MRSVITRVLSLLTIASPMVAYAQSPATMNAPPAVLLIQREDVKPGKAVAHEQWESGWPAAFAKANYPTHYLAMTSISGPNEAWFLTGYPSFEAMEKDNAAMDANTALSTESKRLSAGDGEFLTSSNAILAVNMPAMGYGPPVDIAKMRYFNVLTYRMRPGHAADFEKMATMMQGAYTKAKLNHRWAVYRIASGAPSGTYLVLLPMRSLSELDAGATEDASIGKALGADGGAALNKMSNDGIIVSTSQIMALSPKMSYMSAAVKARDPSFWK